MNKQKILFWLQLLKVKKEWSNNKIRSFAMQLFISVVCLVVVCGARLDMAIEARVQQRRLVH